MKSSRVGWSGPGRGMRVREGRRGQEVIQEGLERVRECWRGPGSARENQ